MDVSIPIVNTIEKLQVNYFVLDVTTADNQYLYQVTVDFLRITRKEATEMDSCQFARVVIKVEDLEFVNLYKSDFVSGKKAHGVKDSIEILKFAVTCGKLKLYAV